MTTQDDKITNLEARIKKIEDFLGSFRSHSALTGSDEMLEDAKKIVMQHDKVSASLLQRRLGIGYARAARILDQLEELGIVGSGNGGQLRDVIGK